MVRALVCAGVCLFWAALLAAQEPPLGFPSEPEAPLPTFEPPEEAAPPLVEPPAPAFDAPPRADEPGYLGLVADDRGEQGQGVRVVEVVAGSPAAQAGLQAGDLIVGLNQTQIRTLADFSAVVERAKPGETLTFGTLRHQEPQNVEVVLGRRPPPEERPFEQFGRITPQPGTMALTPSGPKPLLGVRTEPVTDAARRALGLPINSGAIVRQVIPDSPAARAGLPADSLIIAVNGRAVANPDDLTREVAAAGPGARVIVAFIHGGQSHSREIVLGGHEPTASTRTWKSQDESQPPVSSAPTHAPSEDRVAQLERRIEQLEQLVRHLGEQQQKLLDELAAPR